MTLLQMSISGAVLILVILVIRMIAIHRLPKQTFIILWWIALLRLIVPIQIATPWSVYSLLGADLFAGWNAIERAEGTEKGAVWNVLGDGTIKNGQTDAAQKQEAEPERSDVSQARALDSLRSLNPETSILADAQPGDGQGWSGWPQMLRVIRMAGTAGLLVVFLLLYLRSLRIFHTSLPLEKPLPESWKQQHRIRRSIAIRRSDRVRSPLTYGVIRPVILLPKEMDLNDRKQLDYILEHEYVHICRMDALTKFLLAVAVSVHWFNPAAWLLAAFFNRDMELSCDERVLRSFGREAREDYAGVLIRMAEHKNAVLPFGNGFGKNAIEERIGAIMKFRKVSLAAVCSAAVVISSITVVFATSARDERKTQETQTEIGEETEYREETENPKETETWKEEYIIRDESGKIVGIDVTNRSVDVMYEETDLEQLVTSDRFSEYEKLGLTYEEKTQKLWFYGRRVSMFVDEYEKGHALQYIADELLEEEPGISLWTVRNEKNGALEYFEFEQYLDWEDDWDDIAFEDLPAGEEMDDIAFENSSAGDDMETEESSKQTVIGGADGPTHIFLAGTLGEKPELNGDVEEIIRDLYAKKTDYVGDASAVGSILTQLAVSGYFPAGNYTYEIRSDEEPYGLLVHFKEPFEMEGETLIRLTGAGDILLALIGNLSEVQFTSSSAEGGYGLICTVENADLRLQESIKGFGETQEKFGELLK